MSYDQLRKIIEDMEENDEISERMFNSLLSESFEAKKLFPYSVLINCSDEFYYELSKWCTKQFGQRHGTCEDYYCEIGWDFWYDNSKFCKQLDSELNIETPLKQNNEEIVSWHNLVEETHFDILDNEYIPDEPGTEHSHWGNWTTVGIIKTGYDEGLHDFLFKNEEDAVFFALTWK